MAFVEELESLTKAFSGMGVDERSIIWIAGKWHQEERQLFRKGCLPLFKQDDSRLFERWEEHRIALLQREFLRFQKAVVLWTMHPWERDARVAREALTRGLQCTYNVLIEIACTRSSEELLGARRAYHSLFDHSIEEDVAYHLKGIHRNLLVALVSSYRYEGPNVKLDIAKSEAKILGDAIKNAHTKIPIENDDVVRILTTRSKHHLRVVFDHYKQTHNKTIDEDLEVDICLKETVQCLYSPPTYFCKILDLGLKDGVDENIKEALTRVIITRADTDMKEIKEEFHKHHGVALSDKIEESTNGNFKDLLLTLLARSN